jgi:transposase
MGKRFRECSLDQPYLLPPGLQDWLPEDHLARFIAEVTDTLDLRAIYTAYERRDGRGLAAYHPLMLTRLLLYGYAIGVRSSRRIEKATHDDIAFRYLAADQHPDHDTIAHFRRQHLEALAALFAQALRLCQQAGLVKLGVVALDGTKIHANANRTRSSKHAAMAAEERRLQALIQQMMAEAEQTDSAEDARFGAGRQEPTLPPELARAQGRLERLRQAQRELEQEAQQRLAETQMEPGTPGRPRKDDTTDRPSPQERARDKARRRRAQREVDSPSRTYNFTDPDSRQMHDNGLDSIVQAYNGQLAVDADSQVIVAAELTQQVNDLGQLVPMSQQVERNTGAKPDVLVADAGYWDTTSLQDQRLDGIQVLVSPDAKEPKRMLGNRLAESMRQVLSSPAGRSLYQKRKSTVEPVIGRIKEIRGIRRLLLRGLAQASAEWKLICLTHNLLKLHRHGQLTPA